MRVAESDRCARGLCSVIQSRLRTLRRSCRGCAVWAGAGDLHRVSDIDKAMRLASFGGPAFDLWSFDLDGSAAMAADQVVMVVVAGASPVAGFAVVASDGVELTGVGERSYLVVDGGQGDVLALSLELGVKFLSGAETVGGFQHGCQGALLPRRALLGRATPPIVSVGRAYHRSGTRGSQWSSQWASWEAWRCPSWR